MVDRVFAKESEYHDSIESSPKASAKSAKTATVDAVAGASTCRVLTKATSRTTSADAKWS